jgi:hypothetical protein
VWISNKEVFANRNATAANTWEVLAGADKTEFQKAVAPKAKSCFGIVGTYDSNPSAVGVSGTKATGALDSGNTWGMCAVVAAKITTPLTAFTWYAAGAFDVPVRGIGTARNIQWIAADNTTKYKLDLCGYTI